MSVLPILKCAPMNFAAHHSFARASESQNTFLQHHTESRGSGRHPWGPPSTPQRARGGPGGPGGGKHDRRRLLRVQGKPRRGAPALSRPVPPSLEPLPPPHPAVCLDSPSLLWDWPHGLFYLSSPFLFMQCAPFILRHWVCVRVFSCWTYVP